MNRGFDESAILAIERPDPKLWTYYILCSLVFPPLAPVLLLVHWFRYRTLRYRFTEEGVSMSWGILFRRQILLQYARIQDIHLQSNVVERWLGLARVLVQTASGSAAAEMTLEGLTCYEEVRDFLYARMRGSASLQPSGGRGPQALKLLVAGLPIPWLKSCARWRPSFGDCGRIWNPADALRERMSMADGWRQFTMRCLRVPPPPEPPLGAPGSERVFRSGRNALRLSLTVWAFQQVIAVVGLAFWLTVLGEWRILREAPVREGDVPAAGPQADPDFIGPPRAPGRASRRVEGPRDLVARLSRGTPEGLIGWWTFFERVALATFVLQFPVTYALRRLEYEQRWYVVTDRSLRLRSGVWTVREVTMSFANLQQITVSQNPLQRLLGLSDVRVQSAGGGGGMPKPDVAGESAHLGYFRSVDNGGEIRDLITARLRAFRESGLGDPEEGRRATMGPAPPAAGTAALAAAAELLEETRALRRAWNRASRPPGPPG